MMQTDVLSTRVVASGSVYGMRTRVRALSFVCAATAGSVILKDGGTSGTSRIDLGTPAAIGLHTVLLPGEGVLFETDVYATLTNVTSLTVFYG